MTRTNALAALVLALTITLGARADLIKVPGPDITILTGKSLIQISRPLDGEEKKKTGRSEYVRRLALCVAGKACADPNESCYVFELAQGGDLQEADGKSRREFQVFYVCVNPKRDDEIWGKCVSDELARDFTAADQRQEKLNNEKLAKELKKNKTLNKIKTGLTSLATSVVGKAKLPSSGFATSSASSK